MDQWHRHQRQSAHHQARLAAEADVQLLRDTLLVNFCSVAALTWVIYDLILCFGNEISMVWERWYIPRGRHSRRIYMVVRYTSVLNLAWFVGVNLSPNLSTNLYALSLLYLPLAWLIACYFGCSCNTWYYVVVLNTAVVTLLPDVMMLIRINAIYGWKLSYLLLTAMLFFIQLTTSLGIGFVYVSSSKIAPPGNLPVPGCRIVASTLPPAFILAAWIPSIVVQCIYFSLMLNTFLSVMCSLDPNGRPSFKSLGAIHTLIPTMSIFFRHGLIYFSLAILAKVANTAILLTLSGPLRGIGIPWLMALCPVMATRLKLDLGEFLHLIKPASPLLTPSMRTVVPSFIDPSLHSESGPIAFAPRTSLTLSHASKLDFSDSEF